MNRSTGVFLISIALLILQPFDLAAQPEVGKTKSRYVKNVSKARSIGIANTVVPVLSGLAATYIFGGKRIQRVGSALAIYGLVAGPSTANFYAKDYVRGGLGIAARVATGIILVDATEEVFGEDVARSLGWDGQEVSLSDTDLLIGAGIFVGSMIYNLISAKASVEAHNRKMGYNVQLNPNVQRRQGRLVPMISASIQF